MRQVIDGIIQDSRWPEKSKELLAQLQHLQQPFLTPEEFNREIAYWIINDPEIYADLLPYPLPNKPPAVLEYLQMRAVKKKPKAEFFKDHPEVMHWFRSWTTIYFRNKGSYDWLLEWDSYIPQTDARTKQALGDKINIYKEWLIENDWQDFKLSAMRGGLAI